MPPWGMTYAQDIFQCMMDQILHHCDGMIGITDDVIVHDKDDTEHDRCLHKLMEIAHEHGLVFIGGKCAVKQSSVTFFACVYDKDGTHPDPA